MVEERSAKKILVGKTEGKRPPERQILIKLDGMMWIGFI
jgi:hypothetical protein